MFRRLCGAKSFSWDRSPLSGPTHALTLQHKANRLISLARLLFFSKGFLLGTESL
jgi:hypothetical protein